MKPVLLIKVTLLVLSFIQLVACTPAAVKPYQSRNVENTTAGDNANVSIYFSVIGDCVVDRSFFLDNLEIHDGEKWLKLELPPTVVELNRLNNGQLLLGFVSLPAGDYRKLRLHVTKPAVSGDKKNLGQEGATLTLPISRDFSLLHNDSKCLFVNWHLEDCSNETLSQIPHLSVQGQPAAVTGDTLYVVCDDIDTVYFVRGDTQTVSGSMGFGNRLGRIAYDANRQRLYLVGVSDRVLYSINPATNKVIDRIPLSSAVRPVSVAISTDGDTAYVTDAESDRIIKVDLVRRFVAEEAVIGIAPDRILYFEHLERGKLAVGSSKTQQVYIVDAETLTLISNMSIDTVPGEFVFADDSLYVCDREGNTVAVFNLSGIKTFNRIGVLPNPGSATMNDSGRIFIGHETKPSISVVSSGLLATQRRIEVDYGTFDLVHFSARQLLYAAHRAEKKISVIDLSLEKKINEISLGGTPFAIGMQE